MWPIVWSAQRRMSTNGMNASRFELYVVGVPIDSLRSLGTTLDSALSRPATSEARRAESTGAEEGIRTPTILLSPAPQAGSSAGANDS